MRLTTRKYGEIVSSKKEIHCSNFCNNCSQGSGNCEYVKDMIEKLAEYEDLEEQGLLVKLPCEYGTIVYVVGTRCLAGEEPDKGCDSVDCEECIYNKTYIIFERKVDNNLMCNLIIKDYSPFAMNDNVFLTREAAEEALKRLERLNEQRE